MILKLWKIWEKKKGRFESLGSMELFFLPSLQMGEATTNKSHLLPSAHPLLLSLILGEQPRYLQGDFREEDVKSCVHKRSVTVTDEEFSLPEVSTASAFIFHVKNLAYHLYFIVG